MSPLNITLLKQLVTGGRNFQELFEVSGDSKHIQDGFDFGRPIEPEATVGDPGGERVDTRNLYRADRPQKTKQLMKAPQLRLEGLVNVGNFPKAFLERIVR